MARLTRYMGPGKLVLEVVAVAVCGADAGADARTGSDARAFANVLPNL